MSPEEIAAKAQELRDTDPDMFTHPELKPGEVKIKDIFADAADAQVMLFKSNGLLSARLGKSYLKKDADYKCEITYYPIFVNLEELILAGAQYAQDHPTGPK